MPLMVPPFQGLDRLFADEPRALPRTGMLPGLWPSEPPGFRMHDRPLLRAESQLLIRGEQLCALDEAAEILLRRGHMLSFAGREILH